MTFLVLRSDQAQYDTLITYQLWSKNHKVGHKLRKPYGNALLFLKNAELLQIVVGSENTAGRRHPELERRDGPLKSSPEMQKKFAIPLLFRNLDSYLPIF